MRALSTTEIEFVYGGNANESTELPKKNIYDVSAIALPAIIGSVIFQPGDLMTKCVVVTICLTIMAATYGGMYYFEAVDEAFFFPN